jgi:formiminotetrahydrofolate cyclodeaminase
MMVARDAVDMMDLIAQVAENGNSNAITDACVAMMNARSAVLGALLNVRINLGSVKDKVFAGDMQREADEIEAKAREKETKLLNKVNKDLRV